jgi:hypothetical protein
MRAFTVPVRLAYVLAFVLAFVLVLVGGLAAQDSTVVLPPPDANTQFVLGLGVLAAYIAREVGSLLVSLWNKAGGWLDGKSNGLKQAVAVGLTGSLGLAVNAIAAALTHSTNWIVTFALSIVAGIISTVSAGVTIDAVKSKMDVKLAPYRG